MGLPEFGGGLRGEVGFVVPFFREVRQLLQRAQGRDERLLIQHYGDYTTRIKYYAITANHFLWRADGSSDGGRTWQLDLWKMEATRTR